MQAHGYSVTATATAGSAALAPLDATLSAAAQRLVSLEHEGDWDAIAAQLHAIAPALQVMGVQESRGALYFVFGRVPPSGSYAPAAERELVEAASTWMEVIQDRCGSFSLSPEAQTFASQALEGTVGTSSAAASALGLLLSMSAAHHAVYTVIVDAAGTVGADNKAAWPKADLTVSALTRWTQMWLWETTTGDIIRGGDGFLDPPKQQMAGKLSDPSSLARTIQQLC